MKIFNKTCKILFYTLLIAVTIAIIATAIMYYHVVVKEQPLNFQSIHFEKKFAYDTIITFDIAELSLSTNFDKKLILTGKGLTAQHDQVPLLIIDHLQIMAEIGKLLNSFSIPIDININDAKFYSKNIPISPENNIEHTIVWDETLNKIHSILNRISTHKFLFIGNLNINNAIITHHDLTYNFDFNSTLSTQNKLTGIIVLKNTEITSKINLTINNNKQSINTELILDHFPSTLVASFIPDKYHNEIIGTAKKGLMLAGKISYNISNIHNKNTLDVYLKNLSSIEDKNIQPYLINLLKFNIFIDNKLKNISINNFSLSLLNNTKLKINGEINKLSHLFSNSYKIKTNIIAQNIQLNSLEKLWPKKIIPPARNWLINSMRNGTIDEASCILNITDTDHIAPTDIAAKLQFKNIDLKYDSNFDHIDNISGNATLDPHSAKINIESAKLLSSDITNSTVEVIYDDSELPLIITANTQGYGKDYLNFIGKEITQKILASGLDLSTINSSVNGKVYVKIPLRKDISFTNISLNVDADLKDTNMTFHNDIKATEGNLKLLIDNKTVKLSGSSKINNQPGDISWVSNIGNTDDLIFNHQLILNLTLNTKSPFEELINNNFQITDGTAKTKLQYTSFPKYDDLNSSIDLTNAKFIIADINLVKNNNNPCVFNLAMNTSENNIWQTTKLELISGNSINITAQARFSTGLTKIILFNSNLKFDDNIFNIRYQNLESNTQFSLSGNKINLTNTDLFNYFKHVNQPQSKSSTEISVNVKQIFMPNKIIFDNVSGEFNCNSNICTKGLLKFNMEEGTQATISLTKENNLPKWVVKTNNATSFFKALNIYKNIRGGELTLTITQIDQKHTKLGPVYSGEIELTKFTATKTPILAKLISFSSFRGILSMLQNYTSIPFQKMHGQFIIANNIVRINQTYISGDFLALSVAGIIDLNKKYLNIYGQVVPPVYGFNYILSFLPFLGHEIPGSKGERGLIAANYTIKGLFDNTKASVDPISLILPEIFNSAFTEIFM